MADDEEMVRVRAAGVDRGVWHVMAGLPYPIRRAGNGLRAPRSGVLGMDLSGVLEAVGKGVTRFQPGDEVFGVGKGSLAKYACAGEEKLAPKPAILTFEQAAVDISGSTALQGLRDRGEVEPGQKVLIIGASGGVDTSSEFADGQHRYDVSLDIGGNASLSLLRRALTPMETRHRLRREGRSVARRSDRRLRALMLSPFVARSSGRSSPRETIRT